MLSDKLQPLVEGVRNNKEQWLTLAQNVQNKPNLCNTETATNDSSTLVSTSNNNNNINNNTKLNNNDNNLNNNNNNNIIITSRTPSLGHDENTISCSNGTTNDIPKIVGQIGRLNSQNYFQLKQNGLNYENFATRNHTQEAMDQ